jgi:hypothetical protein
LLAKIGRLEGKKYLFYFLALVATGLGGQDLDLGGQLDLGGLCLDLGGLYFDLGGQEGLGGYMHVQPGAERN